MELKVKQTGLICFYLGLITELIIVIIDKSDYINPIEGQLFRITFLLFVLKIMMTKYSLKEYLCIAFFAIIAMISYLSNGRDEIVRAVIFIASCKDIPLKQILKTVLLVTAIGSFALFFLSVTGIYGRLAVTANFGRGPSPGIVETRYCFGMGHPNAFQCMLFMISTLILYLYTEKMKLIHFAALFAVNVISYMFTDSNTALLVLSATLAGVLLLKYVNVLRDNKYIYILGVLAFVAVVGFSVYGAYTGTENLFMYKLDKILNGRFQCAYKIEAARFESWTLFANSNNAEYFDQAFIRLFYWYGIIPGIVYILSNIYLIYQSYKKKDYVLLVLVVGFSVFCIMEAHLISIYILRNYLFVILGYYWYQPLMSNDESEGYFWQVKKIIGKS